MKIFSLIGPMSIYVGNFFHNKRHQPLCQGKNFHFLKRLEGNREDEKLIKTIGY
jgi:hypothetical protein